MATITKDVEIGDKVYEVEFYGSITIEDHGIGHYEFWGAPGYDSRPTPVINDIDFCILNAYNEDGDEYEPTDEDIKLVDEYLDNNVERIEEDLIETEY